MGNSNTSLQSVIDFIAAKGGPSPLKQPTGYGIQLALTLGDDVMADLITERFNWKWNSQLAVPFYTNSYQQDYPGFRPNFPTQPGSAPNIGWLEDSDRVDINNTSYPKPVRQLTCRRQLPRSNFGNGPINQICWMYNKDLSYGAWSGPNSVYSPLVGVPTVQNPPLAFIDIHGNILVLTTFGTSGSVAPSVAAGSAEGTTVNDGSCVWTVADPMSQGYRVYPQPGGTGPVYQVTPKFQLEPPKFLLLKQLIDPIPDSFSRWFRRGYEIACKGASGNPKEKAEAKDEYPLWLKDLLDAAKQGDKEIDAFGLLPATYPVAAIYPGLRNPRDPGEPY